MGSISMPLNTLMAEHPIYRLRLPQKYECISVGKSIIGNELPTEFGNAGTQVLVTLRIAA